MSQRPVLRFFKRLIDLIIIASLSSGCATPAAGVFTTTPSAAATQAVPGAQATAVSTPQPTAPTAGTLQQPSPKVWVSPALPRAFRQQVRLPAAWQTVTRRDSANLWLEIPSAEQLAASGSEHQLSNQAYWVYALVAPFPTTLDGVRLDTLRAAWSGNLRAAPGGQPLRMSAETKAALESAWGAASARGVQVTSADYLLETSGQAQPTWAVIAFEDLQPRWKVLRVDGQSPFDADFDTRSYPLSMPVWLTAREETAAALGDIQPLPTNRDPDKLTRLVMTGVTALSRHIGERMESKGITYPVGGIREWLVSADLTHISNEVSFYADCPKPGPERADMRFCSNPKYIELLEAAGTDIVELTGNHNLDWGYQPYLDSLDLYRKKGWHTFGGGANLEEAKQPLFIEHNGNQLVFLGCSPAGPEAVWATQYTPGSAPCHMPRLEAQVRQLRQAGYLPVVTFQAIETDAYLPTPAQGAPDFRRMARAGAVIVSGSQSHVPQTMTFVCSEAGTDSFVHYGLGNLFFDQMEPPEARQQFIDRHVFYDGRYLGVELLTALLEDYARPRPMRAGERQEFLQTIFSLSQWSEE